MFRKSQKVYTEPRISPLVALISSPHHHSLVFLAVVSQDKVLELHLHLDPLLVSQSGPDVVRFCDRSLVWLQDHLCAVVVHVQGAQNQDEAGEGLGRGMVAREVSYWTFFPLRQPIPLETHTLRCPPHRRQGHWPIHRWMR